MGKQIKLKKRGDTFHMVRHVPVRYRSVEPRKEVWITLRLDSESLARQKAEQVWSKTIAAWEAKLAGDTGDAEKAFEAAHNLAQARGYRWLTASEVAKLPNEELLDRVAAVIANDQPDRKEAKALLGAAKEPAITVKRALELYWELAAEKSIGKSDDQIRRWKNPRIKAMNNFIKVVGNKALSEITRDDMLDFRDWWSKHLAKGMTANSANKDIGYVESTLRLVEEKKRLGLILPFGKLTFSEDGDDRKRPAFSETWIKDKLLAKGALDKLNAEARAVVHAIVNTGARPSEIVGLLPHHIRLDHDVPHIEIKAEGKQTKNKPSRRVIPLVGVSLEAFRQFPKGFPTYRFKDRISDTVNKFLRENGLLETEEHTLYGLRHSFEDRMLHAKIDERVRRDLMGHSLAGRERYGAGATLVHARDLLAAIAH
ncbi:tyrosine-type recombinase/integrase [Mesorhizobium sp. M1406]|uniref:tyrosine-type recombinase/integrase n=1 Tax=Mesorhizobium sp. M1406 TaxID=2957099 RepID=UPI003337D875